MTQKYTNERFQHANTESDLSPDLTWLPIRPVELMHQLPTTPQQVQLCSWDSVPLDFPIFSVNWA